MKDKIDKFIGQQTCAGVCCVDDKGNPYCFSCFYSYNSAETLLYYKSSHDTQHSAMLLKNPVVAGTILPDELNLLQIRGIQFEGIVLSDNYSMTRRASAHYYGKHPVALGVPGEIWTIQINSIKFTDSTLGFGKKIIWKRTEQPVKEIVL